MNKRRRDEDTSLHQYIAKGAMDVEHGILSGAIEKNAKHIGPWTRRALKVVRPGGYALDAASVFTAKNKPRAFAQAIGGYLGAAAGAAGGMGVASPLTGAIGGAAGSWAAGELYDAGEEMADDYYDKHRAEIDATRRWIDERMREVYARRNDPPVL